MLEALVAALTEGVPADEAARSPQQQARRLLAQLLGWHRREAKSIWWEYFRWLELTAEELVEDRSTTGGLVYEGVVDTIKRSEVHQYRFPRQEHDVSEGDKPVDPATKAIAGTVVRIDEAESTIDLKRARSVGASHSGSSRRGEDVHGRAHDPLAPPGGQAGRDHRHEPQGDRQPAGGDVQGGSRRGLPRRALQKANQDHRCTAPEVAATDSNDEVRAGLADGSVRLAAGTAWLWSRPEMAGSVDVLFIDEAGQLSLANALAVARRAG